MTNSPKTRRQDNAPNPLAVIRNRFDELAEQPITGLPRGWEQMTTGQVAQRLLDPQVPAADVDAVWAALVLRARAGEQTAGLTCVGIALPMLSSIARKLCGHWAYRADTEAMVIVAFFQALSRVDVTRPNVAYRLRWAVFHRTCPPVRERQAAPVPMRWAHEHTDAPKQGEVVHSPAGHPELLLQVAVDQGVITATEAGLIADTRLERRRLKRVAADAGIRYDGLFKRRRRAELRLAAWLRERITDAPTFTKVEAAALDNAAHHNDRAHRHRLPARMSKKGLETRVLPTQESAAPADPMPVRKEVR